MMVRMFRTRDFVLLFTCIVFLVLAIGATVIGMLFPRAAVPTALTPALPADEGGAEVAEAGVDRAARAEALAKKIAADSDLFITAPATVTPTDTPQEPVPEVTEVMEPLLCGNYQSYANVWPSQRVSVTTAEGVRVYRDMTSAASTTIPQPLLTLSLSPSPGIPYCLSTDVIGIANDGSLIRNTEARLYGIFGPDTQIGYALDGFPIYGSSNAAADECGGVTHSGGYRYQVASDRGYILACFSAAPATLP